MAHWALSTTLTAVAGDQSFSSRSSRAREQVLARRHRVAHVAGDAVGGVEEPAHLGEVDAEVGEHPGILRALAREEERQALARRLDRAARPRNRRRGRRGSNGRPGRSTSTSTAARRSASSASDDATSPSRAPPVGCCSTLFSV